MHTEEVRTHTRTFATLAGRRQRRFVLVVVVHIASRRRHLRLVVVVSLRPRPRLRLASALGSVWTTFAAAQASIAPSGCHVWTLFELGMCHIPIDTALHLARNFQPQTLSHTHTHSPSLCICSPHQNLNLRLHWLRLCPAAICETVFLLAKLTQAKTNRNIHINIYIYVYSS